MIGLQLYTLRNELDKNPVSVIEKVANIGFSNVETYGLKDGKFWGLPTKELAKLFSDHRLTSPSGHYTDEDYLYKNDLDSWKRSIEAAHILNQKYMVIAYLLPEYRTKLDDYRRLADQLNVAAEMTKNAGMLFAYHNHEFEFISYDGVTGYDILMERVEPGLADFELDLYWVAYAGLSPVDIIQKYPGRFPLWHVKDLSKPPQKTFTEVGNGVIDFSAIFKLKETSGLRHYFVEQDECPGSPFDSIQKSYDFISNSKFG